MQPRGLPLGIAVLAAALQTLGLVALVNAEGTSYEKRISGASGNEPFADSADFLIGAVAAESITAREAPSEFAPEIETFAATNEQGAPQVFLLEPDAVDATGMVPVGEEWVKALLPVLPNGTKGYLPVGDLSITTTAYRILIERSEFKLTLLKGSEVLMEVPVGIGTGETPTPVGRFYISSLLKPSDPNTIYGTYAYGLSGYSETLEEWRAEKIIGLHGTNDDTSIGIGSSHGCIRMHNYDLEKLIPLLPLGTPIDIS
ncbi:MAG TPA: L,D-transpeptidase [Actinomycetota bacterium]|nr:L,D-transpeptidase [Actinomycetota bacterium]